MHKCVRQRFSACNRAFLHTHTHTHAHVALLDSGPKQKPITFYWKLHFIGCSLKVVTLVAWGPQSVVWFVPGLMSQKFIVQPLSNFATRLQGKPQAICGSAKRIIVHLYCYMIIMIYYMMYYSQSSILGITQEYTCVCIVFCVVNIHTSMCVCVQYQCVRTVYY